VFAVWKRSISHNAASARAKPSMLRRRMPRRKVAAHGEGAAASAAVGDRDGVRVSPSAATRSPSSPKLAIPLQIASGPRKSAKRAELTRMAKTESFRRSGAYLSRNLSM
jgi:hypothetical protein